MQQPRAFAAALLAIAASAAGDAGRSGSEAEGPGPRCFDSWITRWHLRGHTDEVLTVAADWSRGLALSGSWDNTLRLWSLANGSSLRVLRGHTDRVLTVAADWSRSLALSGSWDNTLRLWSLANGSSLRVLRGHTDRVLTVAADLAQGLAVSASRDTTLRVWSQAPLCERAAGARSCPPGRHAPSAKYCIGEEVANRSLPLGCSAAHAGGLRVFNTEADMSISSGDRVMVCRPHRMPSKIFGGAVRWPVVFLCNCPFGVPADNCEQDGQFKCTIRPASFAEWTVSALSATMIAALGLCAWPAAKCLCGISPPPAEERGPPAGAKLLIAEATLAANGISKFQVLLFCLGRINAQVVSISMLAWLAHWTVAKQDIDRHSVTLSGLMLVAFATSCALGYYASRGTPTRGRWTAMDLLLPRGLSISGMQASDGRFVAAAELARLCLCLAIVAATCGAHMSWPPVTSTSWPPATPAGRQLRVLNASGLQQPVIIILAFAAASVALALLHCATTVYLLLSSASAAQRVQGRGVAASVDGPAEALVAERHRRLWAVAPTEGTAPSLAGLLESSPEEAAVKGTAGEELHITLIGQSPFKRVKFLGLTVAPMVLDFATDILAAWNYMSAGHIAFGTLSLTLFIYTTIKDYNKWAAFPREICATLRLGYQTEGLWDLRIGELEDESILSLMLNIYGLPWATTSWFSLLQQLFFIGLSIKGVAEWMVQRDLGV